MKVFGCSALIRHSIAWPLQRISSCSNCELLAGRDRELRFDDVDARDHLGDRMLHLHTRVHLDEVELAVLIEELERPRADVADLAAGLDAAHPDAVALGGRDPGSRRFLDDLLVPPLHRAVPLAEVNRVAVLVGKHLKLDVARMLEELLHIDLIVAERGAALRPS